MSRPFHQHSAPFHTLSADAKARVYYGSHGHARAGVRDRPRPASESRRRRVRPRRDDALAARDRRGHRGEQSLGRRLLPREPRAHLPRDPRALRQGRAGRCDHRRRRARPLEHARRRRRRRARPRARGARPGGVERSPLRAHRQRDGDAPRPDPGRKRHRAARLRPARRDGRARRPRRADRLRPLAAARLDRVRAHRRAAQGLVRDDHEAVRGGQRHHRHAVRVPRPRPRSPPASSRAT